MNEKETISSQISKKTKRPVYNWACTGGGIQHAYYVINKMPKIEPEPEYIFYVCIRDHLRRLFMNCVREDSAEILQYKIKNGKLIKKRLQI